MSSLGSMSPFLSTWAFFGISHCGARFGYFVLIGYLDPYRLHEARRGLWIYVRLRSI